MLRPRQNNNSSSWNSLPSISLTISGTITTITNNIIIYIPPLSLLSLTLLILTLASGVKISLSERYDLFVIDQVEADMTNPHPLVTFVCTTTTLIALNIDTTTSTNNIKRNGCDIAYDLYHKLSASPEQVCKRALSIEPILLAP